MASQSVWGTVESQFLMRRLTLVGANLLFLRALSPLGGQASLRPMKRAAQESYGTTKLRYMTTGPATTMWGLATAYQANGQVANAGTLYTAALLAPLSTKTGPRGPWGNVKIPSIEALDSSSIDSDGWITVSEITQTESFSSLVGLPVVGLPIVAEAWVNCEGAQCTVVKIRRSLDETRPSALTGFEHGVIAGGVAQQFRKPSAYLLVQARLNIS
jgi:hypothetical protein